LFCNSQIKYPDTAYVKYTPFHVTSFRGSK
jgi:hypothetical protein